MDESDDWQEEGLRRAISTLSQSDPLIKLLEQVKLGRMKPTDRGLRAVTESWLATYKDVLSANKLAGTALQRLNPEPRLAVLVEHGILPPDHPAVMALQTAYDSLKTAAVP